MVLMCGWIAWPLCYCVTIVKILVSNFLSSFCPYLVMLMCHIQYMCIDVHMTCIIFMHSLNIVFDCRCMFTNLYYHEGFC